MPITGCGDGVKAILEEVREACTWQNCAIVVGAVAGVAFLGLALTTVLQAADVISLPDSFQWIILAAEGQWPQLLGLVTTTVGGLAVGIVLIAVGTMKKNPETSEKPWIDPADVRRAHEKDLEGAHESEDDIEDVGGEKMPEVVESIPADLPRRMPSGHYWYHPNQPNPDGKFDYYESDADGKITHLSLTAEEISEHQRGREPNRYIACLQRANSVKLVERANLRKGKHPDDHKSMGWGSYRRIDREDKKISFSIRNYFGDDLLTNWFDNEKDAGNYENGYLFINYTMRF